MRIDGVRLQAELKQRPLKATEGAPRLGLVVMSSATEPRAAGLVQVLEGLSVGILF